MIVQARGSTDRIPEVESPPGRVVAVCVHYYPVAYTDWTVHRAVDTRPVAPGSKITTPLHHSR